MHFPALYVLLLIARLGCGQLHEYGCTNAHRPRGLETVGTCFSMEVHPILKNKERYLSTFLNGYKRGCEDLSVTKVTMMARGNVLREGYKYPLGEFNCRNVGFCDGDSGYYYKDMSTQPVQIQVKTCEPEFIYDQKHPNLYPNRRSSFVEYIWNPPLKASGANKLIIAFCHWIFNPDDTIKPNTYGEYLMDFTAEVGFYDDNNVAKFAQVGLKGVQFQPTLGKGCESNGGQATTRVNERVYINGPRTDKKPPTTPRPPPDVVTNPDIVISVEPHPSRRVKMSTTPHASEAEVKEEVFDGCQFTKSCVTTEVIRGEGSCLDGRTCEIVVSFGEGRRAQPEPDETVLEIFGTGTGYVAMGISDDNVMGEDFVIECVREDNEVNIYISRNLDKKLSGCGLGPAGNLCKDNRRMVGKNSEKGVIRPIETSYTGKNIYCRFYIKLHFSRGSPWDNREISYDLKQNKYYVLMAAGEEVRKIGPHGNIGRHLPTQAFSTVEKINLARRLSPYPEQVRYFQYHGQLMIVAFMFCVPVGSFISRYLKETYVHVEVCRVILWKLSHVGCMVLGMLSMILGTVFYLLGKLGWGGQSANFHSFGGIVTLTLVLLLGITGFCLKEHSTGASRFFNILHGIIGHLVFLNSCAIFMVVERVHYSYVPCKFKYIVGIWLITYFALHLVMSYHYCWVDFIVGVPARGYGVHPIHAIHMVGEVVAEDLSDNNEEDDNGIRDLVLRRTAPESNIPQRDRPPPPNNIRVGAPGQLIRAIALGVFMLTALVYTTVLVRKIGTGHPCFTLKDFIKFYKEGSN